MKAAPRSGTTRDGRRFEIRSARPGDIDGLLRLLERITLEEPEWGIPDPDEFLLVPQTLLRHIQGSLERENSLLLVATAGREVIGSLRLDGSPYRKTRHDAELGMSVHRGWRGQGVGGALLHAALEEARRSRILRRITLDVFETNAAARALYEGFGFRVEGRRAGHVAIGDRLVDSLLMAVTLPA